MAEDHHASPQMMTNSRHRNVSTQNNVQQNADVRAKFQIEFSFGKRGERMGKVSLNYGCWYLIRIQYNNIACDAIYIVFNHAAWHIKDRNNSERAASALRHHSASWMNEWWLNWSWCIFSFETNLIKYFSFGVRKGGRGRWGDGGKHL